MDYAIGDIHGCLDKVLRLLEVLRYDPATDRLIFLGDYIDRGPDSKGVLDLMLRLQQGNPANVFLMGNHEDNFLTYLQACLTDNGASYWLTEPFFAGGTPISGGSAPGHCGGTPRTLKVAIRSLLGSSFDGSQPPKQEKVATAKRAPVG